MAALQRLYGHPLALLTDFYELTMAYGYWKLGMVDREAVFHVDFRSNPFGGGYTVACGLAYVVEFLERLKYADDDLAYLRAVRGNNGEPIFDDGFLDYLGKLAFRCDVDAVPEGTVVFAHEPLIRVTGPLLQCQLVESALLNMVNFQTLIATKAARVCLAARGDPVLEFGLRRAQGADGGITASRAAYVGGCAGTSNVLAAKLFDIPPKGTHAHSWVMVFDDELASFRAYARAMPNNSILLVDTYDTLEGVRRAAEVGKELMRAGHAMIAIRLDSGDLAYLSAEARKILDGAGLQDVGIVASGDLDEHVIDSLKEQGAAVTAWGVGTRLVTAHDDPSLGGVYKLTAVRGDDGRWEYKIKVSEQLVKASTPGVLQVRRFIQDGRFVADAIYDEQIGIGDRCTVVDPADMTRRKSVSAGAAHEDLLVPVFRKGKRVYDVPPLAQARARCRGQLDALHPAIKRLLNPHEYPAGLEVRLHDLKTRLVMAARQKGGD